MARAPDHASKHMNTRSVRQESTCSWFVEGDYFQKWLEAPNSFLWPHGIRGPITPLNSCLPLMD
jgi:hypothetical protein